MSKSIPIVGAVSHMSVGSIIREAIAHRSIVAKNQKPVEAIASVVGINVKTLYRWMEDQGQPDLVQFGTLLRYCLYPEGFEKLKELHFPELGA